SPSFYATISCAACPSERSANDLPQAEPKISGSGGADVDDPRHRGALPAVELVPAPLWRDHHTRRPSRLHDHLAHSARGGSIGRRGGRRARGESRPMTHIELRGVQKFFGDVQVIKD